MVGLNITGPYPNFSLTNTEPDQTVVLTDGVGISVTGTYPNFTITNTDPDQIVSLMQGAGMSITGTYPNFTITNAAPDQIVSLTQGTGMSITGTYPNFTITNAAPDQIVALTQGTGMTITGTYPNFTITNAAPDQTVTLTQGANITVTGTYPNFTIAASGAGSALWKNVADGTGTNITPINASNNIFMFGDVDLSTSQGTKMFFDERVGFLAAGNFSAAKSTEALRGTYCQAFGSGHTVQGTSNCAMGSNHTMGPNTLKCLAVGDGNDLLTCNRSFVSGLNNDPQGLVDGCIIGRANVCTTTTTKTQCYVIGNSNFLSNTANDIYMFGNDNVCSTAGSVRGILLGSEHTASSTTAVYNIQLGNKTNDGGFRGQLLASANTTITGTVNFGCQMLYNGGYVFYSNSAKTAGAVLAAGASSWSTVSDKECKEEIELLDDHSILEKAVTIPVYSFKYKCLRNEKGEMLDSEGEILEEDCRGSYCGPMAQDWNDRFNNHADTCTINQQDEIGVLLSCVRALNDKVMNMQKEIDLLRMEMGI